MQLFSLPSIYILATLFALGAAVPAERRQCTIGRRDLVERDTPCTTDADCSAYKPSGVCCTQDVIDNDPFVLCAANRDSANDKMAPAVRQHRDFCDSKNDPVPLDPILLCRS
ncbi:hypothetical protein FA10DRAFT_199158 [Acaromyces ingoldii]|uniref:Uncharacterized protein n=1 Tax=Acaromyces ingoldii TaxID=215250 RepID=A0A316YFA3_9BASI|nr:hypothetical protein FA10DRAFT_199158 [Acaromyces ingoldii]PWN86743.1 hypothetical protein FA10DRAFT_199158 [Acaromyces ingoldii]